VPAAQAGGAGGSSTRTEEGGVPQIRAKLAAGELGKGGCAAAGSGAVARKDLAAAMGEGIGGAEGRPAQLATLSEKRNARVTSEARRRR